MKPAQNNFAYIDAANLHRGVIHLGWQLDTQRGILENAQKEKAPGRDGTRQGSLS